PVFLLSDIATSAGPRRWTGRGGDQDATSGDPKECPGGSAKQPASPIARARYRPLSSAWLAGQDLRRRPHMLAGALLEQAVLLLSSPGLAIDSLLDPLLRHRHLQCRDAAGWHRQSGLVLTG